MAKMAAIAPVLLACVFVMLSVGIAEGAVIEADKTATVTSVHDGDTFTVDGADKVRLADIDTPELDLEPGAYEARNYLDALIYGKVVYLDIDDVYRTDSHGRLVCVAYISYNSTHYLNVNKALLVNGHADLWDHNNEFDPSSWTLYVAKTEAAQAWDSSMAYLIIIAALAIIILIASSKRRRR